MRFPYAVLTALALTMIAPAAWAQTPPPTALPAAPPGGLEAPPSPPAEPPAAVQAPPAGYAPQPSYLVPPAYSYPLPAPAGPKTLPYKDGEPIPDGYHPAMRFRQGLIIGGAITFSTTYMLAAVIGATSKEKVLLVPIVGPFISAVHLGSQASDVWGAVGVTFLVVDGLAQAAGAAMLITGLAQKKQVLARDELATTTVRLTPMMMGYGGMGLGIVGAM